MRCRVLSIRIFIHRAERERSEKGMLQRVRSLGRNVGLGSLRAQLPVALVATNFEQVEQSGIEWSFGDLAE